MKQIAGPVFATGFFQPPAIGVGLSTLHFADGSTRALKTPGRRQHRLEMLLASFDLAQHLPPEGADAPDKPRTITRFENALQLLGRATEIETHDRLIQTIYGVCKQAVMRHAVRESGAQPDGPISQSADTK